MSSIHQHEGIDKLPVAELQAELDQFLQPVLRRLPEKRLRAVGKLAVQGILGSQSPLLTHMARGVMREEETIWPAAKRFYRFVWNKRFSHRDLLKGLYAIAQRTVAEHEPSVLVVAVDPVNLEAVYRGTGRRFHRHEEHASSCEGTKEAADPRLSGDHGDRGQPARAGNHLRQLVLLRDG